MTVIEMAMMITQSSHEWKLLDPDDDGWDDYKEAYDNTFSPRHNNDYDNRDDALPPLDDNRYRMMILEKVANKEISEKMALSLLHDEKKQHPNDCAYR